MKTVLKALVLTALVVAAPAALATPSTVFWSPATTYVQPYLVPHLTYDTYFAERGAYQIDTGLTLGVLPFEKLQGEIGFDLFYPGFTKNGFLLNAKLAVPEGALGAVAPGLSFGIQSLGFEKDVNDYDILHATASKTFPVVGTLAVGGYYGLNDKLLVDENGGKENAGFMASWTGPELKIGAPGLQKIVPSADVMTGKSALGAVGAGAAFYFTPSVALLTGPVFFLNSKVQPGGSDWMWSFQLDADIELLAKR
ncbi:MULTISPECIES: hypothetical protein [Anaeromyxobacter]|uniref:hypothetical protein n=1 Tax=Anaeromyxobacter TaxID=161492 RepID=UPI001F595712|nr:MULTISPECIES: hypothetical protein [unclassified Anaeromyxobacter]